MKMDLKQQLQERPFAGLAASVATGLILGLVLRGGRDETEDEQLYRDVYEAEYEAETARLSPKPEANEPGITDRFTDAFGDELDLFKSAVVTAATGIAQGWIREQFPEVDRQMNRMRQERGGEHTVDSSSRELRGNGTEKVTA